MRDETSSPLLRIEGLDAARNGTRVIRGFDLELRRGEFVGITGPSGCGKSTLLLAIAGLLQPSAGRITLDGRTPAEWGYPHFRRRVTLVAQQAALLEASVANNFERAFSFRSATGALAADDAQAWLRAFRLGESTLDEMAIELSIGEQQRVGLIRALLIRPDVLLLDEPTSALDADARGAVEEALCRERDEHGRAAIIVTHDPHQTAHLCTSQIDLWPYTAAGGEP
jgi:ABC-type iron transport system FetAB ATPase subunit